MFGDRTIGDLNRFAGVTSWLTVQLPSVRIDFHADTTRTAVQQYLKHCRHDGADSPWYIIKNRNGKVNKMTFDPDAQPVPGWFAYTTPEFATQTQV
ncbi:MAG: hypothetical protein WCI74_19340 [Actinomycetes bacterium]